MERAFAGNSDGGTVWELWDINGKCLKTFSVVPVDQSSDPPCIWLVAAKTSVKLWDVDTGGTTQGIHRALSKAPNITVLQVYTGGFCGTAGPSGDRLNKSSSHTLIPHEEDQDPISLLHWGSKLSSATIVSLQSQLQRRSLRIRFLLPWYDLMVVGVSVYLPHSSPSSNRTLTTENWLPLEDVPLFHFFIKSLVDHQPRYQGSYGSFNFKAIAVEQNFRQSFKAGSLSAGWVVGLIWHQI